MAAKNSRRRFLRKSTLAGAVLAPALRRAGAQTRKIPTVELLKIGVVGVGEYSHMPTTTAQCTVSRTSSRTGKRPRRGRTGSMRRYLSKWQSSRVAK